MRVVGWKRFSVFPGVGERKTGNQRPRSGRLLGKGAVHLLRLLVRAVKADVVGPVLGHPVSKVLGAALHRLDPFVPQFEVGRPLAVRRRHDDDAVLRTFDLVFWGDYQHPVFAITGDFEGIARIGEQVVWAAL